MSECVSAGGRMRVWWERAAWIEEGNEGVVLVG